MSKNQVNEREQLEFFTIEQLVPANHLVRRNQREHNRS